MSDDDKIKSLQSRSMQRYIDARIGSAPPNQFNTWAFVREERELMDANNFPALDDLDATWELISSEYGGIVERSADERIAETPLGAFLYYIDCGLYPPPEILLSVQNCFESFLNSGGKYELEDVFFDSDRKKGIGNYAAQKAQYWRYEHLFMCEQGEQRKSTVDSTYKKKSLTENAEYLFDLLGIDDVADIDNFLRGYRRWKKRNGTVVKKNHMKTDT